MKTCSDLLIEFEAKKQKIVSKKLNFVGVGERDVYNITKPFEDTGELIIAVRVEQNCVNRWEVEFI